MEGSTTPRIAGSAATVHVPPGVDAWLAQVVEPIASVPMATIGLVTCLAYPDVTADDQALVAALERRGHRAIAVPWNGERRAAAEVDLLLLRSAWDVWRDETIYRRYLSWLDWVEADGPMLWNPPSTARWSLDKRYVIGLSADSVRIPETVEVVAGELAETMDERRWHQAILKPAVGGSGDGVTLIDHDRARAIDQCGLASTWTPWMLQEFVPEIGSHGETSITVIDGEVTHAVRKLPKSGEYRSHRAYGATATPVAIDQLPMSEVTALLAAVPQPLLYARIDLVIADEVSLIEVEIVDPALWFSISAEAADRLAAAAVTRLP
ncbi:MAG: hypothetical protein AAF547_02830 [Actinomycetota bacterium]